MKTKKRQLRKKTRRPAAQKKQSLGTLRVVTAKFLGNVVMRLIKMNFSGILSLSSI